MTYSLIKKDLFEVPNDYYLAHCVNASYALGAGIAKSFVEKFNMRFLLQKKFPQPPDNKAYYVGKALLVGKVFNLVTKVEHYNKPTYDSLRRALEDMRSQCVEMEIRKIAMPKIGCGLDRLDWSKVEKIICDVFDKCDVEIIVCCL